MNENTPSTCPACGRIYAKRPALSWRDNKTDVCPDCGMRAALEDLAAYRQQTASTERSRA